MLMVSALMDMSMGVTDGRTAVGGTAVAVNGSNVCAVVGGGARGVLKT